MTEQQPAPAEETTRPDQPPPAYREFLARLEDERAKALRNAPAAPVEEVRCTLNGIASGLHIAIAWAITLVEGHGAREVYFAGKQATAHDAGPTVREAAADDRRWWDGEKDGEA